MCLTKAFNIISFLFRSRYWKEAGVRLLAGVEPDFKNKRQTSRTPVRYVTVFSVGVVPPSAGAAHRF